MRLTDFYNTIQETQIEKVAAAAPVDNSEELLKQAEEYVTMGRLMARGYIDEMDKIASMKEVVKGAKGLAHKGVEVAKMHGREIKSGAKQLFTRGADKSAPKAVHKAIHASRVEGAKKLAPYAIAGGAAGAAGLTAHELLKKKEK